MTQEKNRPSLLSRRGFIKAGALGASALILPTSILAEPFRPRIRRALADPVRVRGQIRSGGRGVGGVAISDGWDVVLTDSEGRYAMISTADRDFIRMTVPSGFRIPQNATGTAQFYRPLAPNGSGEMEAVFDLEPLEGSDENHAAFLLADIQTETAEEMTFFNEQTVPDVRATLQTLGNPVAVGIANGDIMYDHLELYPSFEEGVSRMGIPFFQVAGNYS